MNEQDWGLNVGYGEGCTGEGWLDLTTDEGVLYDKTTEC